MTQLLTEGAREEAALDFLKTILKGSPYENIAYLAGGAVRDEVLGKPVKDLDIVVAAADGGIEFANWLTRKIGKYKEGSNPVIYPRFGTAKFNLRGIVHNGVNLDDIDIESVMTRKEEYTPGSRKPKVTVGTLKDDAERRDFTVNSLMKNLVTGEILDLTGKGIEDIKAGIIRSAIDPNLIFNEDPLRMLRAIRFAARYGWKLPLYMVKAIKQNAENINDISNERIQDELNKMLVSKDPHTALELMRVSGLMQHVLPELLRLRGVTQNKYHIHDAYYHTLQVIDNTPAELVPRLAAMFHDIGKADTKTEIGGKVQFIGHEDVGAHIAEAVMKRLRYPNDMIDAVKTIVSNHMRMKPAGDSGLGMSDKAIRKFQADVGAHIDDTLKVMHADNMAHHPDHTMPNQIENLRNRIGMLNQFVNPSQKISLPINGNDMAQRLGIKPGPVIGQLLDAVKNAWFENPAMDKGQALDIAQREYENRYPHLARNLDHEIMNPDTGNMIKVRSALSYDKNQAAYQAAIAYLRTLAP